MSYIQKIRDAVGNNKVSDPLIEEIEALFEEAAQEAEDSWQDGYEDGYQAGLEAKGCDE